MAESHRLDEDAARKQNWKRWGPYLSERQWGTVREDYSPDGNCWEYLSHEDSRSRAYRWGEDGLLGMCDRQCRLCFCVALWNGKDPILKERLFGLTGPEGNHGEDVKENYYYLESSPTHSYMKALYKYPKNEYPYGKLVSENQRRGLHESEFELEDAGVFSKNDYWDITAEYAKNAPQDIFCKITVCNRSNTAATIHVLPTLWYRNTWIWGCTHEGCTLKPSIKQVGANKVKCKHETLDTMVWEFEPVAGQPQPQMLFTENETNSMKMFGVTQYTAFTKDAFHRYVINGCVVLNSRLCDEGSATSSVFGKVFSDVFSKRISETDEFFKEKYPTVQAKHMPILRQAIAGLLWSKQFYHYIVDDWLNGDRDQIPPPPER